MEDHKDDFATDDTGTTDTSTDNQDSDGGGDKSADNAEDADAGTEDSAEDDKSESDAGEGGEKEDETETGEAGSTESDDSGESDAEPVGEKKDANSRIRQLNEKQKALLAEKEAIVAEKEELARKLAEKEEAERKIADLADDPVYTVDDFIGTLDENGDILTDGEAKARFAAWEADYKLRQYEKRQVLKEQQTAVLKLQSETKEAFTKFPEFNANSDKYDPELAGIANEAFRAGLIYADGHDGTKEGDDNFIIGSRINPGELLAKLHKLRAKETPVTKVNNLGDDNGKVVSSQQVNKKVNQYAPGFRGDVDKEIDKLIKKGA
jgi:hypothetical protein